MGVARGQAEKALDRKLLGELTQPLCLAKPVPVSATRPALGHSARRRLGDSDLRRPAQLSPPPAQVGGGGRLGPTGRHFSVRQLAELGHPQRYLPPTSAGNDGAKAPSQHRLRSQDLPLAPQRRLSSLLFLDGNTDDRQALERLAAYILHPSFTATRLRYQPATGQVHYRTAKGVARSMDTLDWIAQVISHVPDPGAQMVRYYGWYSNASRGKRRLGGQAAAVKAPSDQPETEADCFSRAQRQSSRPAAAQDLRSRPLNLSSLPGADESRGGHRTTENHPPDPPASESLRKLPARSTTPTLRSQAGPAAGLSLLSRPARSSSPPIPSSGTTWPPGRIPETYAPGIDVLLGVRLDLPSFRCLVAALVSLPDASLLTSSNTRPSGPHGSLLAHLEAHFSTGYPQLEKQIPIFSGPQIVKGIT